MDFNCDLTGVNNCEDKFAVGGLDKIYFCKNTQLLSRYLVYDISGYIVNYTGPSFIFKRMLFDYLKTDWKSEMVYDENGVNFNLTFSTMLSKNTLQNRKVCEAFINNRVVILFKDNNQKWVLSGLGTGYRLNKYLTSAGQSFNVFNGETLDFVARSRCNFQFVLDPEAIFDFEDSFTLPTICPICSSLVSDYCSYTYASCCNASYT